VRFDRTPSNGYWPLGLLSPGGSFGLAFERFFALSLQFFTGLLVHKASCGWFRTLCDPRRESSLNFASASSNVLYVQPSDPHC